MKQTSFGWWLGLGNISWEKNSRSESFFGWVKQDLDEVDINHTSKPVEKRWSFGSCCDFAPKNSSWKKTDANLIPTPPQEGWGCSSQSSELWLMVANDSRHLLCRILIRTPRIINPPTLKSPTSLGLIGERWSNYVKFTLKTYSTVCWWSSQKKAQWQFTSNDFSLGCPREWENGSGSNQLQPQHITFSQRLITQLLTMYWHMGYRHKWMAKPSMSSMAASFSLLMATRNPAFTGWGW